MGDDATYGIAADRLRSFVERIERLDEEKKAIAGDIKDVYAQAKSAGFNTKVLRRIIAERKLDQDELAEQEQLLDVYKRALGQLRDTPLGEAAVERLSARDERAIEAKASALRDRRKAAAAAMAGMAVDERGHAIF